MQLTTSSTSFGRKRRNNPTERYGSSILLFLESVFHASHQRWKCNTLLNYDDPLIVGFHVNDILQVKPRKPEAEASRGKLHICQKRKLALRNVSALRPCFTHMTSSIGAKHLHLPLCYWQHFSRLFSLLSFLCCFSLLSFSQLSTCLNLHNLEVF